MPVWPVSAAERGGSSLALERQDMRCGRAARHRYAVRGMLAHLWSPAQNRTAQVNGTCITEPAPPRARAANLNLAGVLPTAGRAPASKVAFHGLEAESHNAWLSHTPVEREEGAHHSSSSWYHAEHSAASSGVCTPTLLQVIICAGWGVCACSQCARVVPTGCEFHLAQLECQVST